MASSQRLGERRGLSQRVGRNDFASAARSDGVVPFAARYFVIGSNRNGPSVNHWDD